MNGLEEKQITSESVSEIQKINEEKRRRAARRRAAEKRRRKKRIKMLILASCMVLVIILAIVMALLPAAQETESPEIQMSDDSGDKSEKKNKSDEKKNKNDWKKTIGGEETPYEKLDYYKAFNLDRYEEYADANPNMSVEDVVWRVNANLDMPMYESDIIVSGYDNLKMIVNKYYKVPEGYRPPDLEKFDGHELRKVAGEAYERMRDAAKAEGYSIHIVSGYRSVEYQSNLYNRYLAEDTPENVDRYSARPGYSEHHTGLAMDIFGTNCSELRDFENSPEYPWVRDNCHKYGFIIRYLEETESITGYESEPWHLRYVGTDVSTDMKEKGINNYEEYYAKYVE